MQLHSHHSHPLVSTPLGLKFKCLLLKIQHTNWGCYRNIPVLPPLQNTQPQIMKTRLRMPWMKTTAALSWKKFHHLMANNLTTSRFMGLLNSFWFFGFTIKVAMEKLSISVMLALSVFSVSCLEQCMLVSFLWAAILSQFPGHGRLIFWIF